MDQFMTTDLSNMIYNRIQKISIHILYIKKENIKLYFHLNWKDKCKNILLKVFIDIIMKY